MCLNNHNGEIIVAMRNKNTLSCRYLRSESKLATVAEKENTAIGRVTPGEWRKERDCSSRIEFSPLCAVIITEVLPNQSVKNIKLFFWLRSSFLAIKTMQH